MLTEPGQLQAVRTGAVMITPLRTGYSTCPADRQPMHHAYMRAHALIRSAH